MSNLIRRNRIWIAAFLLMSSWLILMDYIRDNSLELLSNIVHSLFMVIFTRIVFWIFGMDKRRKESKIEK
ncbi:hypothetical protein [Alteribacillus bidgolensis]|uniref:hypothetical protein n=1 Tax=Alteribacillus bidgolensis TaxID=930129 RepID=UPI00111443C2|nr:hypothetical protein [Alteribacillus bidgolensis]